VVCLVIIYSYSLAVKVKSWMYTGHYLWSTDILQEVDTVECLNESTSWIKSIDHNLSDIKTPVYMNN